MSNVEEVDTRAAFAMDLAAGMGITEAGAARGIPRSTAFYWAKQPDVRAEVDAVRAEVRRQVVQRLVTECSAALDALHEVLTTGRCEVAKVSAARTVLEQTRHHIEIHELAERIGRLEDAKTPTKDRSAMIAELRELVLIEGDGGDDSA